MSKIKGTEIFLNPANMQAKPSNPLKDSLEQVPGTDGSGGGGGGENTKVEYFVLDANTVGLTKTISLTYVPTTDTVRVHLVGGSTQIEGTDFNVVGQDIEWDSLGLDGLVQDGDTLLVVYCTNTAGVFPIPDTNISLTGPFTGNLSGATTLQDLADLVDALSSPGFVGSFYNGGDVLFVDPNHPEADDINTDTPFITIQAAINAADPARNVLIEISEGIYYENLNLTGRVTLKAKSHSYFGQVSNRTQISGAITCLPLPLAINPRSYIFIGLTLYNDDAPATIDASSQSIVWLKDCALYQYNLGSTIIDISSGSADGYIVADNCYFDTGATNFIYTSVTTNQASYFKNCKFFRGIISEAKNTEFVDCQLYVLRLTNTASVRVHNCRFLNDTTATPITSTSGTTTLTITHSYIKSGAVSWASSSVANLTVRHGSLFLDNAMTSSNVTLTPLTLVA